MKSNITQKQKDLLMEMQDIIGLDIENINSLTKHEASDIISENIEEYQDMLDNLSESQYEIY